MYFLFLFKFKFLILNLSLLRYFSPTNYVSGPPSYPEDSGYVSGIFHLSANDYVGVRPYISEGQRARQFVANQGSGSYFGMYLLTPDLDGRVAALGECAHARF